MLAKVLQEGGNSNLLLILDLFRRVLDLSRR